MPLAELPAQLANITAMLGTTVPPAAAICVDDVAVNAKNLGGIDRKRRRRAAVMAVAGSLLNKLALMPVAVALTTFAPWAVLPLLALAGVNLAVDGARTVMGHGHEHDLDNMSDNDAKKIARKRLFAALKVDLILSAEVTILTLSLAAGLPLMAQMGVLALTGLAVTAGLYGIIGTIIETDAIGRWLAERGGNSRIAKSARRLGRTIEKSVPGLMKVISITGTVALFVIGGELLVHGIPGGEQMMTTAVGTLASNPMVQGIVSLALHAAVGMAAGFAALPVVAGAGAVFKKLTGRGKKEDDHSGPKPPLAEGPAAAPALQDVPDVKMAMNGAAQKQANSTNSSFPRRRESMDAADKNGPPPSRG